MTKRRSSGEGAVTLRKDGRYMGRVYLGEEATGATKTVETPDGKTLVVPVTRTKRKTVYGTTKKEVLDKLREQTDRKQKGLQPTRERFTVAQLLGEWLEQVERNVRLGKVRNTTLENYRYIAKLVVANMGTAKVKDLTKASIEQMLLDLKVASNRPKNLADTVYRPASDSTKRHAKACLTSALDEAVEQGQVLRNVASKASVPKADLAHDGRTLTLDQANQLLRHVHGHYLEVFVVAGFTMGLRGGEICALRWKDIDFRAGKLTISGTLVRTGKVGAIPSTLVRHAPKTDGSRATLDMPAPLIDALQRLRKGQVAQMSRGDDYVLKMASGRPVERSYASDWLGRVAVEADVLSADDDPLTGHELRHSAASLMYDAGQPLEEVSRLLRHANLNITDAIYRHKIPGSRSAAAGAADRIFGGASA